MFLIKQQQIIFQHSIGAERWGRPHLSSLSFHSLINLRLSLEKAVIILDYDQAKDFTNIAFKVIKYDENELLPATDHTSILQTI